MKKPITYLFSILCSLILIFSLIGTVGSILIRFRALDEQICLDMAESQELPKRVSSSLTTYFEQQYNSSGIPLSVYENAIKPEALSDIIRAQINAGFAYVNGRSASAAAQPDFQTLETDMTAFFEDFAEQNDYEKNDTYYTALKNSLESAEAQITEQCDVLCFARLSDAGVLQKAQAAVPYCTYAAAGFLLLDILMIVFLLALNRKEKEHVFYWFGVSLLIASGLMLGGAEYLSITKWFDRFAVKSDAIFTAVRSYLYALTDTAAVTAACCLGAAVLMLILFGILHRRRAKKKAADALKH